MLWVCTGTKSLKRSQPTYHHTALPLYFRGVAALRPVSGEPGFSSYESAPL